MSDEKKSKRATEQVAEETTTPVPVPVVVAQITVEKFVRTVRNKELASAYAHVEGMQRPVRRMSQEDWQKDFDAWLAQPRG